MSSKQMYQPLSTLEKVPIMVIIIHVWIYPVDIIHPLSPKTWTVVWNCCLKTSAPCQGTKYKELTQNFSRECYLWRESDEMDLLTQFLQAGNFKILGQDGLFSQNHVCVCMYISRFHPVDIQAVFERNTFFLLLKELSKLFENPYFVLNLT